MIEIKLNDIEYFDPEENEFRYIKGDIIRFEYSLKAIYEWEAKWKKPFLKESKTPHTDEEILDFCHMMALDPVNKSLITSSVVKKLNNYMSDKNTATIFTTSGNNSGSSTGSSKTYTSEEIYALMFEAGIPLEFENRNVNRLLIMLKIISLRNRPSKRMSRSEVLSQNARINAQRKAKYKTKG